MGQFTGSVSFAASTQCPLLILCKAAFWTDSTTCLSQVKRQVFRMSLFVQKNRQYDVSLSVFDVLEMTYVSLTNNRIINACLMSIELLYRDDYTLKVLQESMGLYESVMKALNATGNYQMSNGLSNLLYRKFHNETLPEKPERVLQNEFIGKQRDLLETIQKKEKRTNMMLEEGRQ
uniref:Uncharacterized protein n=1 Tax=Cacopsylla melanoneura TaxID=428564 RepID=A0A8D8Z3B8_9HEMI